MLLVVSSSSESELASLERVSVASAWICLR